MFGKRKNDTDRQALEETTPKSNKVGPWWHDKGLRKLNVLLFFPLLSEYTQGYDASIINNVQQLKRWQNGKFFGIQISGRLLMTSQISITRMARYWD